ncbi:MAG: glycine--tRNA ligase subunit beta [Coriobacteriales bacterium]|nr:glycine--tRNA ligase subunit beta [Coriobacteriales bacterium]
MEKVCAASDSKAKPVGAEGAASAGGLRPEVADLLSLVPPATKTATEVVTAATSTTATASIFNPNKVPHEPATLLFEIGTEEIPSTALYSATEQLKTLAENALETARLSHASVSVVSTPRRIVLEIKRLATDSTPLVQRFKGPAVSIAFDADGNPTKAAEGFARGKGVTVRDLTRAHENDVEYVFATVEQVARPTETLLSEILENLIKAIEWPKSQRWGAHSERFSRPVRWLLALWGKLEIPVQFAGLTASSVTHGHRLIAPEPVLVASADDYSSVLTKIWVVASAEMRAAHIHAQVKSFEEASGLKVYLPKSTFDEVVNLVEFPTTLVGHFDEEFLKIPHEIIIDALLSHQRYFPVYDDQRNLVNQFLVVSNGSPSYNSTIIEGHERVVRPRLADAAFFYHEDLKLTLDEHAKKLDSVVFQEKLGTVGDKVKRIRALTASIATEAGANEIELERCIRSADLAKADLVTHAVVEFTSLQGLMGSYYAAAAGEDPQVVQAVAEHYRPRFAGDELPSGFAGSVVALADKLDTLCGIFAIGQGPTGSSDPFALRRAAIGIINILASGLDGRFAILKLDSLIDSVLLTLAESGITFNIDVARNQVQDFFMTRLGVMARDQGFAPDVIDAVMAAGVLEPAEVFRRCQILGNRRQTQPEFFSDLATAFTRANNLRNTKLGMEIDRELLGEAESQLLNVIEKVEEGVQSALLEGRYERALDYLATLRGPIDRFFEDVLIMDSDIKLRENRLRLLNRFTAIFADLADFSRLEG